MRGSEIFSPVHYFTGMFPTKVADKSRTYFMSAYSASLYGFRDNYEQGGENSRTARLYIRFLAFSFYYRFHLE
jgi:hypothetical protein